jgi:anaerobic selenocysteine-containing dehydrogenase
MHNLPSLVKGPARTSLMLHPDDAARLGVQEGAMVRVHNRTGAALAQAAITDEVMPGVVSLPHGFGHQEARDTLRVAGALDGPNVNLLIDELSIEPIIGTSILNGIPVSVAPEPS